MKEATMKTLTPPSVRDIKQVEMTKFKKFVPEEDQADPIYRTPDESVIKSIKDQKNQKVREWVNKNKKVKSKAKEDHTKEKDRKEEEECNEGEKC